MCICIVVQKYNEIYISFETLCRSIRIHRIQYIYNVFYPSATFAAIDGCCTYSIKLFAKSPEDTLLVALSVYACQK